MTVANVPGNTTDFGTAHHLDAGIMDVDHVFKHDLVVVKLDSFGHTRDGEKFLYSNNNS